MVHAYSRGKRFAISIGLNTHPLDSTAPELLHAENAARTFDAYLMESDIPQERRALLLGQQATRTAIYAALERLLRDDPGKQDMVLVYYAGYALPSIKRVLGDIGYVQLDALLATADLDSVALDNPDELPLPGMHTLRHNFIEMSQSQQQLFILDCHYPDTLTPDEKAWMSERMRQLMQQDFPSRGSLVSWTSAHVANDPQFSMQRFTFSLLEAVRGAAPKALKHAALTAQSLYAYICAQQPNAEQHPELSYTAQSDFIIIPRSKKTAPLQLADIEEKPQAQTDEQTAPLHLAPPPVSENGSSTIASRQTIPLAPVLEQPSPTAPLNVFICYSNARDDEKFLEKLHTHLHPLAARGLITYWDKTCIRPGRQWHEETEQAIASAQIAILLVSADLFHQDMNDELSQLIQRAEHGSIILLPISVRHVLLDGTQLQKFKFVNEQPLNDMKASQRDRIWMQTISTILAMR